MPQPDHVRSLYLVDTEAGGDVSRIVLDGVGHLPGATVREQALFLERENDGLRRLLLAEPYGDPAMSVDLVVPPCHREAEAGYIVMEAMGYPVYSGSNTICTVTALLEGGRLPCPRDDAGRDVYLEAPVGLVHARADCRDGRVTSVTCDGGPVYVIDREVAVEVPGHGTVRMALVWSGGIYGVVEAAPLGFGLVAEEMPELVVFGSRLVEAARPAVAYEHPELGAVERLSFIHLAGPVERGGPGLFRSRSATYVHPGVICRSPTGTGTSARLAVMSHDGTIAEGDRLQTLSPRGSSFTGTAVALVRTDAGHALRTAITGRARILARSELVVDLEDPLVEASGLARILDAPPRLDPTALPRAPAASR